MKKALCILLLVYVVALPAMDRDGIDTNPQGMKYPCLSPDGKWVAFSLYGDLWIVPEEGGKAQRLTLHHADEVKPRWSPDGKWIAFNSQRSGNLDIWIISVHGGTPFQLTFDSSWDSISDWTPDGKWIVFFSYRSGNIDLWRIPASGGTPIQITKDGGRDGSISYDGKSMVYTRGTASLWMKGYQGSSNWDLYLVDMEGGIPKQLNNYAGNDLCPFLHPDGKSIYYISERPLDTKKSQKQVYNFWKTDQDGHAQQISFFNENVYSPCFSRDGKKVVFEMDFLIWKMNLDTLKPEKIPVIIRSDEKEPKQEKKLITGGSEMGHWSPNDTQIVFLLKKDIWTMAAEGGQATTIITDEHKKEWPRYSPDGCHIAYCSYENGNSDIYIMSLDTKKTVQLTSHKSHDFYHSWSPDGQTLLFTSERSGNRDIWSIAKDGSALRQLTDSKTPEDDAAYSPDGKWIAFDSGKSGKQQIWIMPGNGDYTKARQLTRETGLTQVASWSPDSKWIAYETNDLKGNSSIRVISVKGGDSMQVVENATLPCWSNNGDYILYESSQGGQKNICKIKAPKELRIGKRIPFFAETEVDLAQERLQVFEEAWQAMNQGFYDENFHSVDWKEVYRKYRPLVLKCKTDYELYQAINRMVGELGASHTGISEEESSDGDETGNLGWTIVPVYSGRGIFVRDVLKDGPADKAWIRKGDYVFKIDDTFITPSTNLAALLQNKAGKEVKLYVSPRYNLEDARYIKAKPVTRAHIAALKYHHWLVERIEMVRAKCQAKVVYIHLTEMNTANLEQFKRIMKQALKVNINGMILDIRNNAGGLIHEKLLDILSVKPYVNFKYRGGDLRHQPDLHWNRPVVLLINDQSYSDAEVFAHAFRELKLGYIVGVPTPGGVIGTQDVKLSNGAIFRIPRVGYYSLSGTNLEGLGIKPDFEIPETPKDRAEGKDPQLEKAIELIMEQIVPKPEKKDTITTPSSVEEKKAEDSK